MRVDAAMESNGDARAGSGTEAEPTVPGQELAYRSVERYFIPESHSSVTTVFPGPSFFAWSNAASTLAPEDVPTKSASSRAADKKHKRRFREGAEYRSSQNVR
jgi:hypothetical protein